jgi:hypothetical protein
MQPPEEAEANDLGQKTPPVGVVKASYESLRARLVVNCESWNVPAAFVVAEKWFQLVPVLRPENLFSSPFSVPDLQGFHAVRKIQTVVDMPDRKIVRIDMSAVVDGCKKFDQIHVGKV